MKRKGAVLYLEVPHYKFDYNEFMPAIAELTEVVSDQLFAGLPGFHSKEEAKRITIHSRWQPPQGYFKNCPLIWVDKKVDGGKKRDSNVVDIYLKKGEKGEKPFQEMTPRSTGKPLPGWYEACPLIWIAKGVKGRKKSSVRVAYVYGRV